MDPDQDLVVLGDRPLDVFEPQDLRRPIPVVDNCPHYAANLTAFASTARCSRQRATGPYIASAPVGTVGRGRGVPRAKSSMRARRLGVILQSDERRAS